MAPSYGVSYPIAGTFSYSPSNALLGGASTPDLSLIWSPAYLVWGGVYLTWS